MMKKQGLYYKTSAIGIAYKLFECSQVFQCVFILRMCLYANRRERERERMCVSL